MEQNETKIILKNPRFFCEKCCYETSSKKDYNKHLLTLKHTNETCVEQKVLNNPKLHCFCGLEFNSRTTLWRHKKKCTVEDDNENKILSTHVIIELVKQNQEFKELLIEQNKQLLEQNNKIMELSNKGTNVTNNVNSHNKTKFNLNFFLNEQCKNALNIMDFVNDLQVKLSDLETVGKLGYTEGITKIFINGLKQLDVCKRPIHCSDLKREVLYVKDQDAWEKENEENKKITKAIHYISHKNIQQIPKWVEQNPNCKDSDSRKNDTYLHILSESMGGSESGNVEKIIHNISKEVVIEK